MPSIEQVQYMKAPIDTVFAALTTQAGLAAIWTDRLSVTPQIGAENVFHFGDGKPDRMRIVELVPSQRQVWHCVDSDPQWIGTEISFDLEQRQGKIAVAEAGEVAERHRVLPLLQLQLGKLPAQPQGLLRGRQGPALSGPEVLGRRVHD